MTVEEQRAADYRAEQIARAAAITARVRGLAGSRSARAALEVAWAPVLFTSGPLVRIARGMFADRADLDDAEAGTPEPMPFTEQLA